MKATPHRQRFLAFSFAIVASTLLAACSNGTPTDLVIAHVNVIPMTSENLVLEDQDVVIRDGQIFEVRPSSQNQTTGSAPVDGRGKWLIPGLVDAHVHMIGLGDPRATSADLCLPYLANGVLQVANLQSQSADVSQGDELEAADVVCPHLALARMIDGSPPIWPDSIVATTPEEGREAVGRIQAEGFDFVKVYTRLNLETFTAIVAEARQRNMKVVGHLPLRDHAMTQQLLQPGFGMVAHAEEYSYQGPDHTDETIARFAGLTKANGTGLIATLTANEQIVAQARDPSALRERPELAYLHPLIRQEWLENNRYARFANPESVARLEDIVDFNNRLVRAFLGAGITIVAGTDSGIPGVVPGFALHDELESLVGAGLTTWQALAAATVTPARWIGTDMERGTIEPGKAADLVLLDADPLAQISNTRRIAAVVFKGQLLSKAELDRRMASLAVRFADPATGR